jgi:hypothetical protein
MNKFSFFEYRCDCIRRLKSHDIDNELERLVMLTDYITIKKPKSKQARKDRLKGYNLACNVMTEGIKVLYDRSKK